MNKTMLVALRFLARRDYSKHELTQKLLQTFDEEAVMQTIEQCCQQGLLSNERFVESRVRHRIAQGYGPAWIRQDLHSHQLDGEMSSEYLNHDDEFWIEQALQLLTKKFSVAVPQPKMQRFLYQRGYPVAVIRQSIKQFLHVNE